MANLEKQLERSRDRPSEATTQADSLNFEKVLEEHFFTTPFSFHK